MEENVMKKKVAGTLALMILASTLAGCAKNASGDMKTDNASNREMSSSAVSISSDQSSVEATADLAKPAVSFEKHADLKMLIVGPMPVSDDALQRLSKEISAITEEKFNCSVNLMSMTFQDYYNKMNMMLATGDQIDIFQPLGNFQTFASQGYLLDLKPYAEYYQDAADLLGDYLKVGEISGAQYGIPNTAQGTTGGDTWVFRKDVVDKLDLQPMLDDAEYLADLEPVFQKIKDNTSYSPFIGTTNDQVVRSQGDAINGKFYIVLNAFTYIDPDEMGVVKAVAKRDTYRQMSELAYKWAQEGIVSYDEVGNAPELFKAGRTASYYTGYSPVVQYEVANQTGMDTVLWSPKLDKPWAAGNSMLSFCVSQYTEAPEQAVAVINEFFINPDLSNILEWGEEGVDYVLVDKEKGLVDFPEGKGSDSVGYYNYVKDSVANQFICYESVNQQGYHQLQQNFQKNDVRISPYIGFSFDASNVENEISACTNVNEKYVSGLMNGLLNPDEYYDQYVKELEDNGLQAIVDEMQKQLDQWIADNK